MSFRDQVRTSLSTALEGLGVDLTPSEIDAAIEVPPDPALGEFAFPCFTLARTLRKAPPLIAAELRDRLGGDEDARVWLAEVRAVGAYVNFHLQREHAARSVVGAVLEQGDRYGSSVAGRHKRVLVDYSSPNIAKPLGVHHLRSTGIGNSLRRIYAFLGYDVVGINFLGDWGTTFGELTAAYRRWGDEDALGAQPIKELLRLYVKFNQEKAVRPELEGEGRAAFKALEDGDPAGRAIWARFKELSLEEFARIYGRMGVEFDVYDGEAQYAARQEETVGHLTTAGLVSESEGATVVELDGMPPCLLKKSDGATLYATRDIAAALDRWERYHFDKSLYVVDVAQSLHFKQVFAVLQKLGCEWAERLEHVSFGRYSFADGSMSTRKGRIVFLEDVFDEAVSRVQAIIAERNPELEDADRVAEQVGVGAVLFFDLKHNRVKDITFTWEQAVNLDGDSGPYLQYTYARTNSLLRKAGESRAALRELTDVAALDVPEAHELIKRLDQFGRVVETAAEGNEPSRIAHYLLELAGLFNSFYHEHRIVVDEAEVRRPRLALAAAVGHVLKNGLALLGIEAPEAM